MKKLWMGAAVLLGAAGSLTAEEIWRLDRTDAVGGHSVTVLGEPRVVEENGTKGVTFDGVDDALIVPINPIDGCKDFTIEILFRPAADGPREQRFLHLQDSDQRRALIETRIDGKGGWVLDTFLGQLGQGKPLIDMKAVHPADRWYWVALRFDGKIMSDFVNGVKELEGETSFGPMVAGATSIGVRQNRVFWFKGDIREVRFHRTALPEEKLQRPVP